MKRKIPLFLRWIGILTIWLITSMNGYAQDLSLYVGEAGELSTPDAPRNGWIDKAWWSTDNSNVEIFNSSEFNTLVRINRYFEGTAKVECTYSYSVYISDKRPPVVGHATKTFRIRCLPNYATLSDEDLELNIGERHLLSYSLEDDNGIDGEWSSSNENVATVFDRGEGMAIVTAISPGRSRIKLDPIVGPVVYCDVQVVQSEPTSVTIPSSLTVYVGESSTLSATLTPYNATTTLTWYSKDTDVATISSGEVTGVDEGTTIVYARTSNGLTSNDCAVTVKYRKPTSVTVDKNSLYLPIGHGEQLKASVSPSNAKYTLAWSSDSTDVAEVSASGYVIAKKQGTARISVTTDNGCVATCVVTVPPMPESLSLPSKIALNYGKSRTLKCSAEPSDAYLSLTWSSSQSDVVTVNQKGEVTACGVGEATITAKAEGGLEAMCKVVVAEPRHCFVVWTKDGKRVDYLMKDHPVVTHEDGNLVLTTRSVRVETPDSLVRKYTFEDQTTDPYPTKIEIESMLTLPYKQTMQMDYRFLPTDFDIETQLVWQSSAPHIVSVDQSGKLLARCKGEAVVSVTASNGVSASCLVEVTGQQVYLVVWTQDGGKVLYPLNEQPSIKHDGNGNYVVRSSAVEVQYPVADVRMFTLADTDNPRPDQPMDIPDVSSCHNFSYSDNTVRFSSLPLGSKVQVYNASGVLLRNYEVSDDGTASININDLPKGIYIIKTESITHKIIKK
ncbi:MAG: Ig-like domain-containing protein [Bacteroidaceae bacterium]|nr:Ig-like domain-containing protein [Bacteroidaceae bacterium]